VPLPVDAAEGPHVLALAERYGFLSDLKGQAVEGVAQAHLFKLRDLLGGEPNSIPGLSTHTLSLVSLLALGA